MKHSLGKMVLLFCFSFLQAEDFSYSFHIDKPNPYVKEAVILTLDLNQTNPNLVLLFNFNLVKSDNYSFQRLNSSETDAYHQKGLHHTQLQFTYLLYPLREGKIDIHFELLKKVTSDDSVAYSFSGDRDNTKTLTTTNANIALPPLYLNVKPLPKGTQIVGDFSLDFHLKKHQAESHEPLPFQITLEGLGYPPVLESIFPKDVNFTYFKEKPLIHSVASTQGLHSTVGYSMALSHSQSFSLPSITVNAFNPQNQKAYTLIVPAQHFNIKEVSSKNLVDKIDSPKVLQENWSWLEDLFLYLVIFIAGYLTALSWKWHKKTKYKERNPLKEKIENCKDTKALLQVLMAHDSHHFSSCITKLENSLYGNGKIKAGNIKAKNIRAKNIEVKLKEVKEEAMDSI